MAFDIKQLLGQMQNIQAKVKEIQAELAKQTVEVSSGGGMVTVTVNGRQEIQKITIDPVCVDGRDIPMLEDLVLSAVNMAMKRSKELMAEELKKLTGGLPLPLDLM